MDDEPRIREAVRKYRTTVETAEVTMSSKRQITLPAAMVRELGLEPGAKLSVYLDEDGEIVLRSRPRDWEDAVNTLRGRDIWGRTKEEVDAYIRWVREGGDEPEHFKRSPD
jgi:antitoxin ChpS